MEAFDSVEEFLDWIDSELARIDGPDGFAMHCSGWEYSYRQARLNAVRFQAPCPPDVLGELRSYSWPTDSPEAKMIRDDLRDQLTAIRSILSGDTSALGESEGTTGVQPRLANRLRTAISPRLAELPSNKRSVEKAAAGLRDFVAKELEIDAADRGSGESYNKISHYIVRRLSNLGWTLSQIDDAELTDLAAVVIPLESERQGGTAGLEKATEDNSPSIDKQLSSEDSKDAMVLGTASHGEPTKSWAPKDLCSKLSICERTLSKYVKASSVVPPKSGGKNHRYSEDDAIAICSTLLNKSTEDKVRSAAQNLTSEIEKLREGRSEGRK